MNSIRVNIIFRGVFMKKKLFIRKIASFATMCLTAILFVSANTHSCFMIHQPKAPSGLERFSKIK